MKPGYKQTEVGLIPVDWSVRSLDQIADPKRPICYGIVQVGHFSNNGIPVLAIKNLNGDYVTDVHRCSTKIEKAYARSRVRPGDVLMSVKGTVGRIGLVPPNFSGNISRDLARIALSDSDIPAFWYQLLQSDMAQRLLEATKVGTTRMELSIGPLKQVKMPRPPKEEQGTIATILSDVDELLGKLEQLIAKKRDLKQAAMQQLLVGQTRLPGYEKAKVYKQTEVGVIPQDWDLCCIESFARIATGTKNTQDRETDGQYPFFVRSQTVERISSYSFDGEAVLTAGDGVGTGKVFHYINGKFDVHQRVYCIHDFAEHVNGYFFFLCFSSRFYNRIMQMTAKSSVDSVRREMIANMLIPLPPTKDEQTAIAAVLTDMDAELAALERRLAKTHDLKKAMMQELLTGKNRPVSKGASLA